MPARTSVSLHALARHRLQERSGAREAQGKPALALNYSRIWRPHHPQPEDVPLHTSVLIPSSPSSQDSAQRQEGAMRAKAWRSFQITVQLMFFHLAQLGLFLLASGATGIRLLSTSFATIRFEIFNQKLQPSLPPVGVKSCQAAEGGPKFQVNHPPLLALDSNSTDPLLACTLDETMIAVKTPRPPSKESLPGQQVMLSQDLPAPALRARGQAPFSPSLEPTSSPAQVIQLGRSGEL